MSIGDPKVAELLQTMNDARGREDYAAYVDAESKLEGLLFVDAFEQAGGGNFPTAAERMQAIQELNRNLVALIDSSEALRETQSELRRTCGLDSLRAESLMEFFLGEADMLGGMLEAALGHFRRAESLLIELPDKTGLFLILPEYIPASEEFVSGLEQFRRTDFRGARAHFQKARVGMKQIEEETIPKLMRDRSDEDAAGLSAFQKWLHQDVLSATSWFHKACMQDEQANGNLAAAAQHSSELCDLCQQQVNEVPEGAPEWILRMSDANLQMSLGQHALLKGALLRDQKLFDDATASYDQARTELYRAAESFLKTRLPQANAVQEFLLNQASGIDMQIRQCRAERELFSNMTQIQREHDQLFDDLREVLRKGGTNVNNFTEVKTAVQQNTNISLATEISLREAFAMLRDAAQTARLDPEHRQIVTSIAEKVLSSQDHGATFIEKTKQYASQVLDLLKGVTDLLPLLKLIAALAGVNLPS